VTKTEYYSLDQFLQALDQMNVQNVVNTGEQSPIVPNKKSRNFKGGPNQIHRIILPW
jgi:hypothetical protein